MRGSTLALLLATVAPVLPASAQDVFRWVKPDGSVTFTDNLSVLPEPLRVEYNRKIAAREQQRAEMERAVGKEELDRRQVEAERARVAQEALDAADRAARLEAMDARLKAYAEVERQRQAQKKQWQDRMKAARANLQRLFQEFQAAEAVWNDLGTRASFSLLPGQAEQLTEAKAKMDALVPQIDAAIAEIEVRIPDEARRASIPPGWLRE